MAALNDDQFGSVFSKMDEMDRQYAHPAFSDPNAKFFHGTTHAIKDGVVRPVNDLPPNFHVSEYSMGDPGDLSEGDHAFAMRNDENYAWHAAHTFHPNGRRPRVYEVEPAADMKPGPWNKEHPDFLRHHGLDDPADFPHVGPDSDDYTQSLHMKEEAENAREYLSQDEWASPTGFKVKNRIDIMPGRQGTFPEVNWNRFKKEGPRYGSDANHPDANAIQYGVYGQQAPTHRYVEDARKAVADDPNPGTRQGRSLREFMEGKPVQPNHGHPTLF